MKHVLKAPDGSRYLSEFMQSLPENCMFNKVTTGCGMTTLALDNNDKYVVAMPYTSLIRNKSEWCTCNGIDHLAVYADGHNVSDIQYFTGDKILCTYDQLKYVTAAIDAKEWNLLVDESHVLLASAGFRRKAVRGVLDSFKEYKSYVFGSATHHDHKYQLEELKWLDIVEVEWANLSPVNVIKTVISNGLYDHVSVLVSKYINGMLAGNAHVFVNSLDSILKVVNKGNADYIRIVCAMSEYNNIKLASFNRRNGTKLQISSVETKVNKVNFYTSTAFEGVDVFDEDGHNYVIADGNKDYTKIDILTTLPQIIGRVRDSLHMDTVEMLYSPSRGDYLHVSSEDEYLASVESMMIEKANAVSIVSSVNNPTITNAVMEVARVDSYFYIDEDDGSLRVNELAKQAEMANWKNIHKTFYVNHNNPSLDGIKEGTTTVSGVPYNWIDKPPSPIVGLTKALIGKKPSFKSLCIEYIANQSNEIAVLEPMIKEAYDKLGASGLGTANYRKSDIKLALIKADSMTSMTGKIFNMLDVRIGEFITDKDMKDKLSAIYKKLGISRKAKAVDIAEYYHVSRASKKRKGVVTNGYIIMSTKR